MTARYLALGDSYTIGEGVAASERWPMRLVGALRFRRVSVEDPVIVARTGWTTGELLHALDQLPNALGDFDLVSLLIGVNDQYRGGGAVRFRAAFDRVLARAVQYAAGRATRVVVLSIPDWGVTPFAAADPRGQPSIAAEIDEFNAITREAAEESGARFVDVTASSRRAAADRALLAGDGLHPSAAMYDEWAALVMPHALVILKA